MNGQELMRSFVDYLDVESLDPRRRNNVNHLFDQLAQLNDNNWRTYLMPKNPIGTEEENGELDLNQDPENGNPNDFSKLQNDLDSIPHKSDDPSTQYGSVPPLQSSEVESITEKLAAAGIASVDVNKMSDDEKELFKSYAEAFETADMKLFRRPISKEEFMVFAHTFQHFKQLVSYVEDISDLGLPPDLAETMDKPNADNFLEMRSVWQQEALIELQKSKMMVMKALFNPTGL